MDAGKIDGFSMKSFALKEKTVGAELASAPNGNHKGCPYDNTFENEFYFIEIKPNGCIDATDKTTGIKYFDLLQIADSGDCGSIWVHSKPEKNIIITNENVVAEIKKLKENSFITEYEIKYSLDIPKGYDFESKSRSVEKCVMDVTVKISLSKKTRYIGVEIELENRSRFHQVRVLFPSGITNAQTSMSGQPFDVVERKIGIPDGFDYNIDPNCEYHPMQDFCAVTNGNKGFMVFAKGIYEYEAVNDNKKTLALTLLRSTCFDMGADDNIGGYNMEKSYMLGKIKYELAVMPFDGDWRNSYPYVLDFINPPIISFKRNPDEAVLPGYKKPAPVLSTDETQFIKINGEDVYITAVKREENGENLLIRVVSFSDREQNISISMNNMIPCKKSWQYSLKEIKGEQISEGNTAKFKIMPKQIITVGFEM